MSCQDMVPWPLVAPGDFDYYEERAGQGELIQVQAFDQNQQVGHGLQDRQGSHEFAQVSKHCRLLFFGCRFVVSVVLASLSLSVSLSLSFCLLSI